MYEVNNDKRAIGYLGPKYSYSNLLLLENFSDNDYHYKELNSIRNIFMSLDHGAIDYGLIPIRNSNFGEVKESIIELNERLNRLTINKEFNFKINHCLITLKDVTNVKDIQLILSHPQAIGQCTEYIEDNLSNVESIYETTSTSVSTSLLSSQSSINGYSVRNCASISSYQSSLQFHNLHVLDFNIQNDQSKCYCIIYDND